MLPAESGASILVIDDDARSIRLLSEMLRSEGYRLYAALSGKEGFQRAMRQPPAMVLLDLHMPDLDGVATCRLFKGAPGLAGIPIIFLTGSGLLEDKLQAFAEGAVDYIVKPFSTAEVIARLRVHLRSKTASYKIDTAHDNSALALAPAGGVPAVDERIVSKAQAILLRDLATNMSLSDLARAVGSNERSLTEAFRRRTGLAVFEFLRQERFRGGCELLLHSHLQIGQIGAAMGFQSAAAFTYSFRMHCGMTPGQYRLNAGLALPASDDAA